MAEEKDEEYHMDDSTLSGASEQSAQEEHTDDSMAQEPSVGPSMPEGVPVVYQRALAVVGMILLVFAMYKIIMWMVHLGGHKSVEATQTTQPAPVPLPSPPVAQTFTPPPQTSGLDKDTVDAKFTELSTTQQETQSNLQSINNQVSNVESQLQSMNEKISALSTLVQNLNTRLEEEKTKQVLLEQAQLARPAKPRPPRRHVVKHAFERYFLQAAIPGRAWLIRKNGTGTITVRVGSHVPGYGMVSEIDANAGRVQMASGKIITFERSDN